METTIKILEEELVKVRHMIYEIGRSDKAESVRQAELSYQYGKSDALNYAIGAIKAVLMC